VDLIVIFHEELKMYKYEVCEHKKEGICIEHGDNEYQNPVLKGDVIAFELGGNEYDVIEVIHYPGFTVLHVRSVSER
jgi:hypothetical protein